MPKSQRQRERWRALEIYIHNRNGWVVSPVDGDVVRFECPIGSQLPDLIRQMGYRVVDAGTAERMLPVVEKVKQAGGVTTITAQSLAPAAVSVFEFDLFCR